MSIAWARHIAPGVLAVYGRDLTPRPWDTVQATMNGVELEEVKEPFAVHHARQYFQLWECNGGGELVLKSNGSEHGCDVEDRKEELIACAQTCGALIGPQANEMCFLSCTFPSGLILNGFEGTRFVRCKFYGERPIDAEFKPLKNISFYDCDFYCSNPMIGEPRRLGGENLAVVNCRTHNCNRPLVIDEYTGPQINQVVFGHWSSPCPVDNYRNERDGYVYHCSLVDRVQGVVAGSVAKLDRATCTRYGAYAGRHMYAAGYILSNRASGEWGRIVSVQELDDSLIVKLDRNFKATGRAVELWCGGIRTNCAHIRCTSSGGRFGLTYWGCTQDEVVHDNTFNGCQQPVQVRDEEGVSWSDRMVFGRNRAFGSMVEKPVWRTPGGSALPPLVGVQEW